MGGIWRRRPGLALAIAASLLAGTATAGDVTVAHPRADAELEPIAAGVAQWLRNQLRDAGLEAVREPASGPLADAEVLERAAQRGSDWAVLSDLRFQEGRATLGLRLFAPETRELAALARGEAPLEGFGAACQRAAEELTRQLGWREVEGRLTPTAMRTREEIVALARQPDGPPLERARVLAASGDDRSAWGLIAQLVGEEEQKREPDPEVLRAAGEVQLSAGNLSLARRYLDLALGRAPDDPETQLALARVLAAQSDGPGARAAFTRAAELDPANPSAFVAMARLEGGDPRQDAALLVEAGRRAALHLDVERAERYLEREIRLDPARAGESWRQGAALAATLGRQAEAIALYQRVEQAGGGDAALYRNLGRAHRAAGDPEAAELALRRALVVQGDEPETLRELGLVYLETSRADEALPLLQKAAAAEPGDERSRYALARALHATGHSDEALALLASSDSVESLREAAAIHGAAGRPAEARDALARAVAFDPNDPLLRALLADARAAAGDPEAAARERDAASDLGGAASGAPASEAALPLGVAGSFEGLALSFASQTVDPATRQVALLGVRLHPDWREQALQWLHPRSLDRGALERALDAALGRRFGLAPRPPIPALLEPTLERLYAFESGLSLDAEAIAEVNQVLGTHAVFLGRVRRVPAPVEDGAEAAPCDGFELELRMLSGKQPGYASILANRVWPESGLQQFGAWNARALPLYAVALLALLYPLLRGWGTILVRVELPPRTKGFFALRVSRHADAVSAEKKQKERFRGLRRTLRYLSRYHRSMVGRETVFRWIPLRPRPYTVTLMGPLKDATRGEIIGHFLEERRVRLRRGKAVTVEYDLRPKECAVEVRVLQGGKPARGARVAVAGDPGSLRYAPDGTAFLYLGKGSYRVLLGGRDRVAAQQVEIRSLENAIPVCVDLAEPATKVFDACLEAVEPYLQSDYASAAAALERGGQTQAARLTRAEHHRQRGDAARAAEEFEAAGRLGEAAELRAGSGGDASTSAQLFERAGDHARAAESYREAGELAAAARAYEAAYDFDNALECYEDVGDEDKVIELLERTGAYLDAAQRSRRRGDAERALRSLQHIARNDSSWVDGCAMLAELLAERGDHEVALEKFAEALGAAGGEQASAELLERHARLLEKCGEPAQALKAWSAVARRDPGRAEVGTRMSMLREEIQRSAPTAVGAGAATRPSQSRYERLEEIGRGGMGVVYKARDRRLGRMIALKELPASLRDHPEAVKLFLREARAAASLNHRNIVTVHDAGEEGGSYFISMELLEGLPLNKILARRGALQPRDVARLGVQVAAGLAYATSQRVIHRDIKTANLFFTRDRIVKIMDFGLAKTLEEVRKSSTLIGGTPYYMAPEQAVGGAVDQRADLYALGVTLFQLVTGELPFREGDLGYHHQHTPAPDPREIEAGVPESLARLILQLLEKEPAARPQTAADVGTRLQQILGELG